MTDGNTLSSSYPCICGVGSSGGAAPAVCADGEFCTAAGQCQLAAGDALRSQHVQEAQSLQECSGSDGQSFSSSYPCSCGVGSSDGSSPAVCEEGDICMASHGTCSKPASCDVTDGGALSSSYPCVCGVGSSGGASPAVCADGEVCAAGQCQPVAATEQSLSQSVVDGQYLQECSGSDGHSF